MNKTSLATAVATALLFTSFTSNAGFLDKLVDRVERRVEDTVADKIAKKAGDKAGEATDAVINPEERTDDSTQEAGELPNQARPVSQTAPSSKPPTMKGMGGLGSMMKAMQQPVDTDDSYRFDMAFVTESTYENKTDTMEQGFAKNAFYVKVDDQQSVIMDLDNKAMIMIDNKRKTKSAMSTDVMKQLASMGMAQSKSSKKQNSTPTKITRTGETKDILGYSTEKWTFEDDKHTGDVWIAKGLDFDFVAYSKRLIETFGGENNQAMTIDFSKLEGEIPMGYPLESTTYKNGKLESSNKVVSIYKEPLTVDLSGHKLKSMMDN